MQNNWIKATQSYQAAALARQQEEKDRLAATVREQVLSDVGRDQMQMDIDQGTIELEQFMRNEGQAAMELLQASNRHICFGENYDGGGFGEVYFIDGRGLQKSIEAMGMWVAYRSDIIPKPELSPITARQAIQAAAQHGGKKATEVVSWLHAELDKIASAAPATK
jgi:hypothetical protein